MVEEGERFCLCVKGILGVFFCAFGLALYQKWAIGER